MSNKVGIILEGGAMRSIFSAGVLDYFAEKDIEIPNVLWYRQPQTNVQVVPTKTKWHF